MSSSRKRTPIIQRSKGAGTVALVITLACAGFGVGEAAAGDGSYARHVREQRLVDQALAHRTPEQFVLAIQPKSSYTSAPPVTTAPAASPAPGHIRT